MKYKFCKCFLALGILSMSHPIVYAENMNLIYDGANHFYDHDPIHLYIDGQEIVTQVMPPIQLNSNILVPAKEVFSTVGAEVEWRSSEKSVYIHNEETLIVLKINSNEAWVNGETKPLNMPAKLINDKVMIPLRFISEALGYQVAWSSSDSSVYIETPQEIIPPTTGLEEDFNDESSVLPNDYNDMGDIDESNGALDELEIQDNLQDSIYYLGSEYIECLSSSNTLVITGLQGLQLSGMTYEENIHTRQVSVNLNGDYSQYLPDGTMMFPEGNITQIDISNQMGSTQLVVTTATIMHLNMSEQNGEMLLQFVRPREQYNKIVVIDAGHGAHDPGTSYEGIQEKNLNLALSQELNSLLEADSSIKVYATREDDTFLELMERVEFSNQIEPDLFISIHINSAPNIPSASGTETYYTISSDTRNKTFATMVQEGLVNEFGTKNRGVKSNTFVVTRYTDAPAILIEIGFLTNESDRKMMTSSDFASRYAKVVYQCILDYYAAGFHNQ